MNPAGVTAVRAPACRRNLFLGEASEGAVEAPSDYYTTPSIWSP
jgi:hypothetical protein